MEKLKISIFGGISKFLKHILTKFGSLGQFWKYSTAMAKADSMPSFERKKKENVITFAKSVKILHVTACWKAL